jgi:AcrR family transcriptional regulator
MPRRTSDNELIRTAQRGRILQAAADVFARKGFAAARISDVATRAGVSHGLVHH